MELNTERLRLREFRMDDFEAVCEYETQPQTHTYERDVPSEAEIADMLRQTEMLAQEQPRTCYRLAVTIRPEDRAVGLVSLRLQHADIGEWEVGWTIHYAHWNQGYATEAAREVLNFAFQQLHAHRVVAFCHVGNTASRHVMEKIGMQCEGRLRQVRQWQGGWSDEFVYAILDCDWQPNGLGANVS